MKAARIAYGSGFAAEHAERIFEPFRRLHGCERPGTGLGLAIAKKVAEQHRGRIWAESKPGEGAAFYVELPSAQMGER